MPSDDILEPIRTRAYQLWEQAGRPDGGDVEFWERARQEVEAEGAKAGEAKARDAEPGAPAPEKE